VRCFANAAAHLAEGGVFLIEAFVPTSGGSTGTSASDELGQPDEVNLDASRTTRSSSGSTACTSC
jgi:hypothetical protein